MGDFKFYYPIQVRYSDFDTQWHVNNVRLAAFLEQARFEYVTAVGMFKSRAFHDFPFVVADLHISFLEPVFMDEPVRVGVRTSTIGTKSLKLEYVVENPESGAIKATADTVAVGYDNVNHHSIVIKDEWRALFEAFEGRSFAKP